MVTPVNAKKDLMASIAKTTSTTALPVLVRITVPVMIVSTSLHVCALRDSRVIPAV